MPHMLADFEPLAHEHNNETSVYHSTRLEFTLDTAIAPTLRAEYHSDGETDNVREHPHGNLNNPQNGESCKGVLFCLCRTYLQQCSLRHPFRVTQLSSWRGMAMGTRIRPSSSHLPRTVPPRKAASVHHHRQRGTRPFRPPRASPILPSPNPGNPQRLLHI